MLFSADRIKKGVTTLRDAQGGMTRPATSPLLTPPPRPVAQPGALTLQNAQGEQTSVPRPSPSPTTGRPMLQPPDLGGRAPSAAPSPVAGGPVAQSYPASNATPPTPNAAPNAAPRPAPTPQPAPAQPAAQPAPSRDLYAALRSFNTTQPNYGRDPQAVVAALRSSDPQLQQMAQEAVKHLEPSSAYQYLADGEFERIYGVPKASTLYGVQQQQAEELRRYGRTLTNAPLTDAQRLAGAFGGGQFQRANITTGADQFTPAQLDAMAAQWRAQTGGRFSGPATGSATGGPATGGASSAAPSFQAMLAGLSGGQPGGSFAPGVSPAAVTGGAVPGGAAPIGASGGAPTVAPQSGPSGSQFSAITGTEQPFNINPTGRPGALEGSLLAEAQRQLANPSVYDDQLFQDALGQGKRALDAQYDDADQALRAELAGRGIEYGSIAGTRYAQQLANKTQGYQDLLRGLLRERAASIGGARSAAFGNALAAQGYTDSRAANDRAELRGERAYRDTLNDKARDQSLQEYLLGRDERRYNDANYQDILRYALQLGQGGAGISALGGAGNIYGAGAGAYGQEAAGYNDYLAQLAAAYMANRGQG